MKSSGGRLFLLTAALFAAFLFADWTDDYHDYAVGTLETVFQEANGRRWQPSGGSSMSVIDGLYLALSSHNTAKRPDREQSGIEAVFGSSSETDRTADETAP